MGSPWGGVHRGHVAYLEEARRRVGSHTSRPSTRGLAYGEVGDVREREHAILQVVQSARTTVRSPCTHPRILESSNGDCSCGVFEDQGFRRVRSENVPVSERVPRRCFPRLRHPLAAFWVNRLDFSDKDSIN